MHFLIALDKFKDSFSAQEGCRIVQESLTQVRPQDSSECCPLSDGGEGFVEILSESVSGQLMTETVHNARGQPQTAHWGLIENQKIPASIRKSYQLDVHQKSALIEMAQASGLQAIPTAQRKPWQSNTYGTGQLIAQALKHQVSAIFIGLGGSATNDLGLGALHALGLHITPQAQDGTDAASPINWQQIEKMDSSALPDTPPIYLVCDVDNPVLGQHGCTYTYGPQKGLIAEEEAQMEAAVAHISQKMCHSFQRDIATREIPGSGAAGGIGFGLHLAFNAQFIPGFSFISQWLAIPEKVTACDSIITGEGRFDASSLQGKGPGSLIELANQEPYTPIYVFAGSVDDHTAHAVAAQHIYTEAISPDHLPLPECLKQGPQLLAQTIHHTFSPRDV